MAKVKNMSAQVVLQNYMFERFLERLSKSEYRDNFILKGGMLIAALVGIDSRATMDMDTTVRNYPISIENLTKAITLILNIEVEDDVIFTFKGIEPIREDDQYGGFRASIEAKYDTIVTPLQMDITTGDAITPKEVMYSYKKIFEDVSIGVWAYNIETVLAEKVETIISRGELNTRPRDFYDVYILLKTQNISTEIFQQALRKTAEHRSSQFIFEELELRVNSIKESEILKSRWVKYTKDYQYAADIKYSVVMEALSDLLRI